VRQAYSLLAERRIGVAPIVNVHRRLADLAGVFALLEAGDALKCAVVP
jgi:hypothetical protein